MAKAGYTAQSGAVALSSGVARTVLCVLAPAQFGVDLRAFKIGFDASALAGGVLVELCSSTLATNSVVGTNNTAATVRQAYGRAITAGFTAFAASTVEPTVLTVLDSWTVSPTGALVIRDFPAGAGYDTDVSTGLVIRCTSQSAVNARSTMDFERC